MFFHRTALLADDQSTDRVELAELLRPTGLSVVGESRTTDDALDKIERLRPDVVVVDVTLPGTLDALVAIQRMRRLHPDAVIFATGMASQNDRMMEALTMGAADFFLKPYQPASIRSCLQRHL